MPWMHDVFVSYAHTDNAVPPGYAGGHGWITTLADSLRKGGPNFRQKDVFIDHGLLPGDAFGDDLVARVEGSATLLLVLSQNYLKSDWCGKELEHFLRRYAGNTAKPPDVFVVELCPYEDLPNVPAALASLRKQLIHAKFWHRPADSAVSLLAGYPTPAASGQDGERHYWRELNNLLAALDRRLSDQQPVADIPPPAATPGTDHWATVLLADVTDDLETQRGALRAALEAEGIAVLPQGDYVGLEADEFEERLAADLAGADTFVQLLSPTVGRKGRLSAPLPQLQYRRALERGLPIMQWCERQPEAGSIADNEHAALFATQTLRATHLVGFQTELIAVLRAARAERDRAAQPAQPLPGRKQVFVDDLAAQPDLRNRLRSIIKAHHCDIRSLPPAAPLGNNGIDFKQVLKPCRAGITVYANPEQFSTVYHRLLFCLNQIAEGGLPVAWGVYLEQGTVDDVFGIDAENVVGIGEHELAEFLGSL